MLAHLIDRARIPAPHDVSQYRVAVAADVVQGAHHARHRHVQQHQHVRDQHETRFEGFRNDVGGSGILQLLDAGIVLGAHQHRHLGPHAAHAVQDADRGGGIGETDDHRAGGPQPDFREQFFIRRIAEHDRVAGLACGADARRVEVERDVFESLRFQHPRHVLADAAEAAQDDVLAPGDFMGGSLLTLAGGGRRGLLAQQPARDALVVVEDQRAQQHRQHDRDQQRLAQAFRRQPGLQQDGAQRDPELTADGHDDAGAQRLEARGGEWAGDQRGDGRLEHHQREQHEQHDAELADAPEQVHVEQHAHGDEEQPEQDVAERADHRFDLVPVFGLGEHHPRQERAEGERQTGDVRHPRRGEHHQQHRQREQLTQAAMGDLVKQRPQQPAPGRQHRHDREHAADHRHDAATQLEAILSGHQRATQGEERHERQVLEQQHAEREPPVRAVEFGALGELLQQDGGRAHRHRAPQHDRDEPRNAEQVPEECEHAGGGDDLGGSKSEDLAPHGEHAWQRELQPQREQQERHAELGQQSRRTRIRHHAQRVWSEHQADYQVSHARGQPQAPRDGHQEHGPGEQNESLGERSEH